MTSTPMQCSPAPRSIVDWRGRKACSASFLHPVFISLTSIWLSEWATLQRSTSLICVTLAQPPFSSHQASLSASNSHSSNSKSVTNRNTLLRFLFRSVSSDQLLPSIYTNEEKTRAKSGRMKRIGIEISVAYDFQFRYDFVTIRYEFNPFPTSIQWRPMKSRAVTQWRST